MKKLFKKVKGFYVNKKLNETFPIHLDPIKMLMKLWNRYVEEYLENLQPIEIEYRNYLIKCKKENYWEFQFEKLNPPNEGKLSLVQKIERFIKINYSGDFKSVIERLSNENSTEFWIQQYEMEEQFGRIIIQDLYKRVGGNYPIKDRSEEWIMLIEQNFEKWLLNSIIELGKYPIISTDVFINMKKRMELTVKCELYEYLYIKNKNENNNTI